MKARAQTELPLFDCSPPGLEAGIGRCWSHLATGTVEGTRLVVRLCSRAWCLCPVCAAGDAVVAAFEARQ